MDLSFTKSGSSPAVLLVDKKPVAADTPVTFRADVLAEMLHQMTSTLRAENAAPAPRRRVGFTTDRRR